MSIFIYINNVKMTEKEKYIQQAEKKGSKVFINLIEGKVQNYERMPDNYGVDFLITGTSGNLASVEIKDRRPYTSTFVDTVNKENDEDGQYLELVKYNNLTATTVSGYSPFFCAIYEDKIVIWDIMTLRPTWEEKVLQTDNFYKNKGKRIIYRMHISEAIKIYETINYN